MLIDPKTKEFFTNEMILVKANAEKDDSLTAKHYQVSGYPTFVLTDSKGVEIDRIVGYMPTDGFLAQVVDYKNGIGTLADLLNKADSAQDRAIYMLIADKYKYSGRSEQAAEWFNRIVTEGEPTDSMSGEALFGIADMKNRNREYDASIADFRMIKENFKGTPFEETAGLYVAYVTMRKGDTTNAIIEFENFVKEFPESEDFDYATGKIDAMKNAQNGSN